MDRGKGNGDLVEKLRKAKMIRMIITIVLPVVVSILFFSVIVIAIVSSWERILPIFTSSSSVGVNTIYDNTYLMEQINNSLEGWTDEEKYVFTEMVRQKDIWVNDYVDFGIIHNGSSRVIDNYETNDLDLVKFVVTIQHQGAVNLGAYGYDYSSTNEYIDDENQIRKNDYEGEILVYNNDTKDFYIQAGQRLGSTFFLYPGLRQLMGNSISANITYTVVHPSYAPCSDGNGYCLQNLDEILSDWKYIGNMYMAGEQAYNEYYSSNANLGPRKAASILADAINYGYENCIINVPEDKNDWNYVNICSDYKKIFEENNGQIMDYNGDSEINNVKYSVNTIEQSISESLNGISATIPSYEYNSYGNVYDSNINLRVSAGQVSYEQSKWFIAANVKRINDWDVYDEYLKEVYIPYLYINCENCNSERTAEGILSEMKQLEATYRYYNRDENMNGNAGGSGSANVNYTCSNGEKPHVATYDGHHGLDINSVPVGTNIYPLFEGEVVEVNTNCRRNYSPERHYNSSGEEYYTCATANANSCGYGTYIVIQGKAKDGKTYNAWYAHLNSVNVTVGQHVDLTTVVGTLGNTGCSTGAHLHLELRDVPNTSSWHWPTYPGYSYNDVANVLCSRTANEEVENEA